MLEDHYAFLDTKLAEAEERAEAWRAEHLNEEGRRFVAEADDRFGAELLVARVELLSAVEDGVSLEDALEAWECHQAVALDQFMGTVQIAEALSAGRSE